MSINWTDLASVLVCAITLAALYVVGRHERAHCHQIAQLQDVVAYMAERVGVTPDDVVAWLEQQEREHRELHRRLDEDPNGERL